MQSISLHVPTCTNVNSVGVHAYSILTTHSSPPSLPELNDDILLHVFSYLGLKDRIKIERGIYCLHVLTKHNCQQGWQSWSGCSSHGQTNFFFFGRSLSYRLVIQNDLSCIWMIMWVGPVDTHSACHSWNGISNLFALKTYLMFAKGTC